MAINQLARATEELGGAFSPERIKYSLEMTALGLLAVFAVLTLIWIVLAVFKYFLSDISSSKKNETSVKAEKKVESAPVVEVTPPPVVNGDDATVAAIMAAISAYIADDPELSEQYPNGFKVVSFKRVRGKAFWNSKNN